MDQSNSRPDLQLHVSHPRVEAGLIELRRVRPEQLRLTDLDQRRRQGLPEQLCARKDRARADLVARPAALPISYYLAGFSIGNGTKNAAIYFTIGSGRKRSVRSQEART